MNSELHSENAEQQSCEGLKAPRWPHITAIWQGEVAQLLSHPKHDQDTGIVISLLKPVDIYIGTVAIRLAICFVNPITLCVFEDWGMVLLTFGYLGMGDHRGSLPQTSLYQKSLCVSRCKLS